MNWLNRLLKKISFPLQGIFIIFFGALIYYSFQWNRFAFDILLREYLFWWSSLIFYLKNLGIMGFVGLAKENFFFTIFNILLFWELFRIMFIIKSNLSATSTEKLKIKKRNN